MTFQHELVVYSVGLDRAELGRAAPGGLVSGLRENASYLLEIVGIERRLYVDDIPLVDRPTGQFAWASGFYAGRVEVISVCQKGVETSYYLEIAPATQKVHEDQFASMIDAIRQFDQRLLLGDTAACLGFGRNGAGGIFDERVRWERLRRHGHAFLKFVETITRSPHASLTPIRKSLPLAQVKRIPVSALHDRRIAALAKGQSPDGQNIDSIQIQVQVPAATVDTPANQAICALLKRFQQALNLMKAWAKESIAELADPDALARCQRRLEILHVYDADVRRLLNTYPFRGVKSPQTTAAGLTQVAANPKYARAYRTGTEVLRLGTSAGDTTEHLRVSPSWGVYESWCYVALIEVLEWHLSVELKPGKSKFPETSPDLVLLGQLPDGRDLEILFQPTFRSQAADGNRRAWSLSRERRPDIVLVVSYADEHRTFILDAKYRSGRSNVLDAMASAHIYHDSLILAGLRPDLCLLLLPGTPAVEWLEKSKTWATYGVGTISDYSVGGDGVQRCAAEISKWLFPMPASF